MEVEDGSKPAAAGVTSAFKFWVMLSSMEARDNRRKSEEVSNDEELHRIEW